MLVIDAAVWPSGDPTGSEALGRTVIGRVSWSAQGDWVDYPVVHDPNDEHATEAILLRRRHVMAGWRDLLWVALDGEASEPVALDDPRVATVAAKVRDRVTPSY